MKYLVEAHGFRTEPTRYVFTVEADSPEHAREQAEQWEGEYETEWAPAFGDIEDDVNFDTATVELYSEVFSDDDDD